MQFEGSARSCGIRGDAQRHRHQHNMSPSLPPLHLNLSKTQLVCLTGPMRNAPLFAVELTLRAPASDPNSKLSPKLIRGEFLDSTASNVCQNVDSSTSGLRDNERDIDRSWMRQFLKTQTLQSVSGANCNTLKISFASFYSYSSPICCYCNIFLSSFG